MPTFIGARLLRTLDAFVLTPAGTGIFDVSSAWSVDKIMVDRIERERKGKLLQYSPTRPHILTFRTALEDAYIAAGGFFPNA